MTMPPTSRHRFLICRAATALSVAAGVAGAGVGAPAWGQVAAPETLGIFEGWGAFRGPGPRCWAIATPAATIGPRGGAYLTITHAPAARVRGQFYARLSRPAANDRPLALTIGEIKVPLMAQGVHAWTAAPGDEPRIRAEMRAATSLSITGTAGGGGAIADTYRLRGAATAIDAATLGCAR